MYKSMYEHDDLINLSEEIVFEQIHQVIQDGKPAFAATPLNIQDVAAIALNQMPAKYVTSILERHNPSEELREEVAELKKYARRQVLKAIRKVNEHPHE
ncbi:late competence development ComFB family protein [Permianibacter sp. IMCC34836]|uniref:late competence development ComFB family protein n=1 Tax=Permianibacter fluminis TaxID=2738515 RepID=UPI00155220DA|nr:late competence development ComFB family protein [Permianibacter fluminis]NQD38839.1 late competence development ComFB family protein [Permianibacter fluminis]